MLAFSYVCFGLVILLIAWQINKTVKMSGPSNTSKKSLKFKEKYDIPLDSIIVMHFEGDSYPRLGDHLYFAKDDSFLFFWNMTTGEKIEIAKDNIINFSIKGERTTYAETSGGGVSVGGALVGGAIAGPVGAVIGGRKKTKTNERVVDTRKVILKFKDNDVEKGLIIQFRPVWDTLCFMCPEKKIV